MAKTKDEMVREIIKLLMHNDYNLTSVFECGAYLKEHLKTNQEWVDSQGGHEAVWKKFRELQAEPGYVEAVQPLVNALNKAIEQEDKHE